MEERPRMIVMLENYTKFCRTEKTQYKTQYFDTVTIPLNVKFQVGSTLVKDCGPYSQRDFKSILTKHDLTILELAIKLIRKSEN